MGYTFIYAPYPSLVHINQIYRIFPDLVKLIIGDTGDAFGCYHDTRDCALTDDNPTGIPPWKIFSFVFWPGSHNPLGIKWTISPEDYASAGVANNTYLGYSIEEACRARRFVPHVERENQAWILAKYLSYFTPEGQAAWSTADFDAVTEATGIELALGAYNDSMNPVVSQPHLPSVHVNHGRMDQLLFTRHLSRSRVLIGMGNPVMCAAFYPCLPNLVQC